MSRPQNRTIDLGTRMQALALAESDIARNIVAAITQMSEKTVRRLQQQARNRGYDPQVSRVLLLSYVEDAPRSGRPATVTEEIQQQILDKVRKDRNGREKPGRVLAAEHGISVSSVINALHKYHMNCVKRTMKTGLMPAMKEARLKFCRQYQHWTIEDWKRVIWSDETSVVLGQRRGRVRVWRTPWEQFEDTVIRRRYKGYSEFMFWACFTYDFKGPCHCWTVETAKEKKAAQKEIDALNVVQEKKAREEWELVTAMARTGLRKKGGRKPAWKFTAKRGAIVRKAKGGSIDHWRYRKEILEGKISLSLFVREISHSFC